jgi:hypothetical protein
MALSVSSHTSSIVAISDIEKMETEAAPNREVKSDQTQPPPASTPVTLEPAMKDEKDPKMNLLMEWNDENDPENPQNWSLALRSYHAMVPGLFGFAV